MKFTRTYHRDVHGWSYRDPDGKEFARLSARRTGELTAVWEVWVKVSGSAFVHEKDVPDIERADSLIREIVM